MTSTEIALLLQKDEHKIARIGEIISKKIPKRDVFNGLNKFEKTFIYIDIFENHTSNGGFEEFFLNSSGQFAHEILDAYQQIQATETASLIYDAFIVFDEIPIPKDKIIRRKIIENLPKNSWEKLDNRFYKSSENIIVLVLDFIKKNINQFD